MLTKSDLKAIDNLFIQRLSTLVPRTVKETVPNIVNGIVVRRVKEIVPPMVDGILVRRINEMVPPMVDKIVVKRVDEIVTRRLKPIERRLIKIEKDLRTTSDFLDRENLKTVKRVDRIEKHLDLPPLDFFPSVAM